MSERGGTAEPDDGRGTPRSRLRRAASLLLALALTVAALELAVRWWVSDPERLAGLATGFADAPWRLAWVQRRERIGVVTHPIDTVHPTRGWTLTPNLRAFAASVALVSSTSRGARCVREPAAVLRRPADRAAA